MTTLVGNVGAGMGKLIAEFSMSLDGFVAAPDGSVAHVFDWYGRAAVRFDWPGNELVSEATPASAAYLREIVDETGALLVGRRVFDFTDGWGGHHPMGVPVFVLSHHGPEGWDERHDSSSTTFVGDLAAAVEQAQSAAGRKSVGVAGPNVAQQCINRGLLDEIRIDLVPVLLGQGIPFFANLETAPEFLGDPRVIVGDRVTHLIYPVER